MRRGSNAELGSGSATSTSSTSTSPTATAPSAGSRRSGRMAAKRAAAAAEAGKDSSGDDEAEAVYCVCRKSHENGFMIACDECDEWFHGKCVNISAAQGRRMEKYVCPLCSERRRTRAASSAADDGDHMAIVRADTGDADEAQTGEDEPLFSDAEEDESEGNKDDGDEEDDDNENDAAESNDGQRRPKRKVRAGRKERRGSNGWVNKSGDQDGKGTEGEDDDNEEQYGEAFVRAPWYDPETDQVDHAQWEAARAADVGHDGKGKDLRRRGSGGDIKLLGNSAKRRKINVANGTDDHSRSKANASEDRYRGCDAATKGVRELVVSTLADALSIRTGGGKTETDPASVRSVAEGIEAEMWKMFEQQASAAYKAKYRTLLFNLKDERNQELRDSVLSGEMGAAELCKKTSQELAPAELAQWRKQRAEKYFHENVMITADSAVIVKKTHKGEEILHAPTSPTPSAEPSLTPTPSASSSVSSPIQSVSIPAVSPLSQSPKVHVNPPKRETRTHEHNGTEEHPQEVQREKQHENEYTEPDIDINVDVSAVLNEEDILGKPLPALLGDPNPTASKGLAQFPSPSPSKTRVNETNTSTPSTLPSFSHAIAEHPVRAPSRPAVGDTPGTLIWRGSLVKANMENCNVVAHHLAGPHILYMHILPEDLQVQGRVDLSKLAKYVAGLAASRHRIHSLMILEPTDVAASVPYIAMLHYFGTKSRAGVVINLQGTPIKEVYVIPITSDDVYFRDILRLEQDKLLAVVVTDKDFLGAAAAAPALRPS